MFEYSFFEKKNVVKNKNMFEKKLLFLCYFDDFMIVSSSTSRIENFQTWSEFKKLSKNLPYLLRSRSGYFSRLQQGGYCPFYNRFYLTKISCGRF